MKTITIDEIDRYIAENQTPVHASLRPASSYVDQVIDYFHGDSKHRIGTPMPWSKTAGKFDLRPGEVTLWLGINGHGKSLIQGQIATHLMAFGEKCCTVSPEMHPYETMARMCRQASGGELPTIRYINDFHRWTDNRMWIFDNSITPAPKIITNLAKYSASLGVGHLFVDSLMKVIPDEDDYNGQKRFVNDLCFLAQDLDMHIHLVHHSRKLADERKAPGKFDAKGTGAISDLVDNCVTVFRNKDDKRTNDQPDTFLIVDKQRHGGWEGTFGLYYNAAAQCFCEDSRRFPKHLDIGD